MRSAAKRRGREALLPYTISGLMGPQNPLTDTFNSRTVKFEPFTGST